MKTLALALVALCATSAAAGSASVCPKDNTHTSGQALQKIIDYKNSDHEIMAGYFRSWRDIASDPKTNKVAMDDLPDCLDIAFVFPEGDEPDSFYTALKDDYVPTLRQRGTKVVRSISIAKFLDDSYPNNEAGYKAQAKHILDTYVTAYDLDGLDVDVEQSLSKTQVQKVTGVFSALSKSIGPKSGTGKLFIYDTNQDGSTPLFRAVYPYIDYVLVQSYGRQVSGLQSTWDTYSAYIDSKQYLIGFSFYEEGGARWGDVTPPIRTSRAGQYAKWEPSGASKGGIFSYAIERDGVPEGEDEIVATDFSWTRELIFIMNP